MISGGSKSTQSVWLCTVASCPWCREVCSPSEGNVKCGYSQVCVMKNNGGDALLGQESSGEPNVEIEQLFF